MEPLRYAAAALMLASGVALAQTPDHEACYKVKDSAARTKFSVTLSSAGVAQTCTVLTPATIACLETPASGIVPNPPGGAVQGNALGPLLCYKLKCPRPVQSATMTDALGGQRTVGIRAARFLCAPAAMGPASGGPPTTSTTLAQEACHFDDNDRQCRGTCAGGGHCSATTSGGSCECRGTPCGDADTPECNGFCDNPGEVCSFVPLNDCSCISIP